MKKIKLELNEARSIGDNEPAMIVAEIGQNHNGDAGIAKRLIDSAAAAAADAVKFCKRHIPSELTLEAYDRPYQDPHSFGETYGQHREFLELSREQHRELSEFARERGLIYFSSACDIPSVDDMEWIGVPLYKVASRDLTNIPLIDYIAQTRKPVVLSTGMATVADIDDAVNTVKRYHSKFVLLTCTSEYPCAYEHVNLRRMATMRARYGCLVGFSGHTIGVAMPTAVVALGAKYIEKHFTLDRGMKGTDHAGSLEFDGLRRVVRDVRHTEEALGSERISFEEYMRPTKEKLGKSLVSTRNITQGCILQEDDVCLKSPGCGIIWRDRDKIVGRRAKTNIESHVTLREEWFE